MAIKQQKKKKKNRLLILGMSLPSLMRLVDYSFDIWDEVWGLNEGYLEIPKEWMPHLKFTRWFEVHAPKVLTTTNTRSADHLQNLNNLKVPVYVREYIEGLDNQVLFDYKHLTRKFGWDWFQSSLAWMLASAMDLEIFDEIGVFGVDMLHLEYHDQRPGFMHLMYVASNELGIKFILPANSGLFMKPKLYGIDQ